MEAFNRIKVSLHHRIAHAARQAAKPDLGPTMALCIAAELTSLRTRLDENFNDILQTCSDSEIAAQQEAYQQQIEELFTATSHLAPRLPPALDGQPSSSPAPSLLANGHLHPPRMELPTFSGKIAEWPTFAQLFLDGVDGYSITSAQKLLLLSTCLKGDAKAVISFLRPSPTAFDEAWALLRAKYENEAEVVYSLASSIFDLPVSTTAAQIENVVDTVRQVKRAFQTYGCSDTSTFSALVIPFLLTRVSVDAQFAWKQTLSDSKVPPVDHLLDFLQLWARNKGPSHSAAKSPASLPATAKPIHRPTRCPECSLEHHLVQCPSYKAATCEQRWATVRRLKLCTNCLSPGHGSTTCRSSSCRTCSKRHHTTLHAADAQPKVSANTSQSERPVLLATALIRIIDGKGNAQNLRALIDGGSQASLITSAAAQHLHLPIQTGSDTILNAVGSTTAASKSLCCNIQSAVGSFSMPVHLMVVPTLVAKLPATQIPSDELCGIQRNLPITLADPTFHTPGSIDILLGAEVYARIITDKILHHGHLVVQQTLLGWVLFGSLPPPPTDQRDSHVVANLTRFWELEELPPKRHLTKEEQRVEQFVASTAERHGGRFQVRMPLKTDPPDLGASRHIAMSRLLSLERKFAKNAEFAVSYKNVIHEYFMLGHLEAVTCDPTPLNRVAYLPHHAVFKDSSSTKLRVVFDASARTSNGKSLNDCQANGPRLQQDILPLLIKFRSHPVAITADIEKMYRQITLHEKDRDLQRVLWRASPNEPVQDYRLTTVTFGEKAAPYLAVKTLHMLADQCESVSVATVLKEDFYVDDLLSGATTPNDAASLLYNLQHTLHNAGFSTHKWASNSPEAIQHVPEAARATSSSQLISSGDGTLKTLGILWDTESDTFRIQIAPPARSRQWTRRAVLSATNGIYDPLGWIAPATLVAKLLLQQIIKESTDWDTPLTPAQQTSWLQWWTKLPSLASVTVPRCLKPPSSTIQLCGFSDASERAYGAVVYARITLTTGETICRLVAAKTKVSPLKPITLPRLELLGALLLARLISLVSKHLNVQSMYCYTDSTITLSWLQGEPSRWNTFVANRVAELQQLVPPDRWQHVKGCENPADLASRGVDPHLLDSAFWWTGPAWLTVTTDSGSTQTPIEPPEQRRLVAVATIAAPPPDVSALLRRFSSFEKLRRVLAYVMMFIDRDRTSSVLQPQHFQQADYAIYRCIQLQWDSLIF